MAEKSIEFGRRLKNLMTESGLNMNRLAKKLGMYPSVIASYLKGRIPEAPILYKLAKEFGVTMEGLLTGEGIDKDKKAGKVINFSRRREDALFKKHPKLKEQLDLLVKYWMTGNPYIKILFEAGIKLSEGLAKAHPTGPPTPLQRKPSKRKAS
jgi:transcriptional regulator with XRE-family HTH domain